MIVPFAALPATSRAVHNAGCPTRYGGTYAGRCCQGKGPGSTRGSPQKRRCSRLTNKKRPIRGGPVAESETSTTERLHDSDLLEVPSRIEQICIHPPL